jgi:hypothetical protein
VRNLCQIFTVTYVVIWCECRKIFTATRRNIDLSQPDGHATALHHRSSSTAPKVSNFQADYHRSAQVIKMHIVKHVRQYYTSFHNNDVAITSSDIAKAMRTYKRPNVGVDNIIEEAQMDLYKSYLQHTGLSAEAASKAASSSFPTPQSYNDFLLFQSPNPPEAQRPCKHVRHPANRTQTFVRHCPECMFSIHLQLLDVISSKLAAERALCLSDPKRSAGIGTRYHRIKGAWIYARATLANYVRLLELLAAREHLWEARNSRHISPETKSATKALHVAANSSYQFLKTHNETTPNPNHSPGISPKGMPKPTRRYIRRNQWSAHIESPKTDVLSLEQSLQTRQARLSTAVRMAEYLRTARMESVHCTMQTLHRGHHFGHRYSAVATRIRVGV